MADYPRITLQIKDAIPQIILESSKDDSKELIDKNDDLKTIFDSLQNALQFETLESNKNSIDRIVEMSTLSNEGDERYIEELPEKTFRHNDFDLQNSVESELEKALSGVNKYEDLESAVKKELIRNQHLDILASILEMIYNIMIAKTLDFASEMGIGNIGLDDQTGLARLKMKMVGELTKLDIELDIA